MTHSIDLIEKVFEKHFAGKEAYFRGSWWVTYDKEDFIRFALEVLKEFQKDDPINDFVKKFNSLKVKN